MLKVTVTPTNLHMVTPSNYLSGKEVILKARKHVPKAIWAAYKPTLRVQVTPDRSSVNIKYNNMDGPKAALGFDGEVMLNIPDGVDTIFVDDIDRLIGAGSGNEVLGFDIVKKCAEATGLPTPPATIVTNCLAFAERMLNICSDGGKGCFFMDDGQFHTSPYALVTLAVSSLPQDMLEVLLPLAEAHENTLSKELIAKFWLRFLLYHVGKLPKSAIDAVRENMWTRADVFGAAIITRCT